MEEKENLDKTSCSKCGYRKTGGPLYKCFGIPMCPVTRKNPALDNSA